MVALVQALLLKISPSLMLNLSGTQFWSDLEESITECDIPGTENIWYHQIFIPLWGLIIASISTQAGGLVLAILYFLFRPKGEESFQIWWKRGFYASLLAVSCVLISIACTLVSLLYFLLYLIVPSNQICATMEAIHKSGSPIALGGK